MSQPIANQCNGGKTNLSKPTTSLGFRLTFKFKFQNSRKKRLFVCVAYVCSVSMSICYGTSDRL